MVPEWPILSLQNAFHHGKIDLMQASAVCDLIHARSAWLQSGPTVAARPVF